MIEITVYSDEVLFRLDQLPKKIRENLRLKFEVIFDEIKSDIFQGIPGKFLDPKYIESGITEIGSTVIGFMETTDKPGFYSIVPTKAKALRFVSKSGDLVHTRHVNHPFLKGAPIVARYLLAAKPWILQGLEDAARDALRR